MLSTASIEDFKEFFSIDDDELETDSTTVNGWLTEMAGSIPETGYKLEYKNLCITVTKADDIMTHRIENTISNRQEQRKQGLGILVIARLLTGGAKHKNAPPKKRQGAF